MGFQSDYNTAMQTIVGSNVIKKMTGGEGPHIAQPTTPKSPDTLEAAVQPVISPNDAAVAIQPKQKQAEVTPTIKSKPVITETPKSPEFQPAIAEEYSNISTFADKEDTARMESLNRSIGQIINKKRISDVFKSMGNNKFAEDVLPKSVLFNDGEIVDLSEDIPGNVKRMLEERNRTYKKYQFHLKRANMVPVTSGGKRGK